MYIAGGITPKVITCAQQGGLYNAFLNLAGRDKFTEILRQVPIYVVMNDKVGQIGAREVAMRLIEEKRVADAYHS